MQAAAVSELAPDLVSKMRDDVAREQERIVAVRKVCGDDHADICASAPGRASKAIGGRSGTPPARAVRIRSRRVIVVAPLRYRKPCRAMYSAPIRAVS